MSNMSLASQFGRPEVRTCAENPSVYSLLQKYVDGHLPYQQSIVVEDHCITCRVCSDRREELYALKGYPAPAQNVSPREVLESMRYHTPG